MRLQNSSCAATTISAAADGVGARRSATKSAIVMSVSCPTAEMTGTGQLAIARATISSLNAHRSSIDPPPRPTMTTSTPGTRAIARKPREPPPLPRPRPERARPDDELRVPVAPAQHLDDVAHRRAVERGDDADLSRQRRQRPLPLCVEQPLGLKSFFNCSNASCSAPSPCGSRCSQASCIRPSARRPKSCRARQRAVHRPA